VDGEHIKAHSQILCARSDVFTRQLNGSLRESVTKEIIVEDCNVGTFKALLKFIYTDDLSCVRDTVTKSTQSSSSVSRVTALENVLAVSHKYELVRLGVWAEQQLCECITTDEVCSVLCKAHLYGARKLEKVCLAFAKENFAGVMTSPLFAKLPTEWPAVVIKLSAFMAGVPEHQTIAALDARPGSSGSCKRKRDD